MKRKERKNLCPHWLQRLWARWNNWRLARVRFLVQWGPRPLRPYHITLTPRLGFSIPWLFRKTARLRWAPHHGGQVVVWNGYRWVVRSQLWGHSKITHEVHAKRG